MHTLINSMPNQTMSILEIADLMGKRYDNLKSKPVSTYGDAA